MRAYSIAMFLIIFNMSIVLVGALGFSQGVAEEDAVDPLESGTDEMEDVGNWDWTSLVLSGTGIFAGILSLVFRLPVGATVFAITFTVTGFMAGGTLNTLVASGYIMSEVQLLITTALAFIFLFAFIQLSSSTTGD